MAELDEKELSEFQVTLKRSVDALLQDGASAALILSLVRDNDAPGNLSKVQTIFASDQQFDELSTYRAFADVILKVIATLEAVEEQQQRGGKLDA